MKIKLITNPNEIKKVCNYLKSFDLDYFNYKSWVEECKKELVEGYKKGFYAEEDSQIIGEIIFQAFKTDKSILEIKSLRVSPQYQRKKIASKLYESLEKYIRGKKFKKIQVDTHEKNMTIIRFFLEKRFKIIEKKALYEANKMEVILCKNLKKV